METQDNNSAEGKVSQDIPAGVAECARALPEGEQGASIHVVGKIEKGRFPSPLPPPEILDGYAQILPNAPERILHMAEEGQRADNAARNKMIDGQNRLHTYNFIRYLIDAAIFLTVIVIIVRVGFVLALKGHSDIALRFWGGGGVAVIALGALVVYFRRKK